MTKFISIFFLILFTWTLFSLQAGENDKYQSSINPELVAEFNEARALRREGDFKNSIHLLKGIIKKNPNYYLANYNTALLLAQNGEFQDSIKYFEISIKIKEKNRIPEYSIYNSAGWVFMQIGDYKNAEMYLKKAIRHEVELSSKSKMKTYNNIGLLNIYKADYRTGEIYLKKAIDLGSKLAEENLNILNKLKQKKKK